MPSIDPSNDNRIIVQKGLSKKNNVESKKSIIFYI